MTESLPLPTHNLPLNERTIQQVSPAIQAGDVVVFPTDTVYGIGCYPYHIEAIGQVYKAKKRPLSKGLPLLISDWDNLSSVTDQPIQPNIHRLLTQYWPGGLTIIVQKHPDLPSALSPNNGIAVRMPNHTATRALIRACGGILATSSANLSGNEPALTALDAEKTLHGRVHWILDGGQATVGQSSTILDCRVTPPQLVREGAIPSSQFTLTEDI